MKSIKSKAVLVAIIPFILSFIVANIFAQNNELVSQDGNSVTGGDSLQYLPIITGPPFIGEGMLFSTDRDGNREVYVMAADGSGQTNLTNDPDNDVEPSWSPDGTQIAFASNRSPQIFSNHYIYIMNADGTDPLKLEASETGREPVWSPDGQSIVFALGDHIYQINVDGSNLMQVVFTNTADSYPDLSPNGQQIVFHHAQGYNNSEIYKVNIDGSGLTRLTFHGAFVGIPKWSPDGTRIAYSSDYSGNWEIYLMNADGSSKVNISNNAALDGTPVWSPDGTQIAFISDRDGDREIYVMNLDGSGVVQLTHNDALDVVHDWR